MAPRLGGDLMGLLSMEKGALTSRTGDRFYVSCVSGTADHDRRCIKERSRWNLVYAPKLDVPSPWQRLERDPC